ncbi:hypothetical protein C8R44DRAFT_881713 [Mycena epipterygia]|nr:hypothetical protein C8R44DRAFT_881713 [Mycena epipterygia]
MLHLLQISDNLLVAEMANFLLVFYKLLEPPPAAATPPDLRDDTEIAELELHLTVILRFGIWEPIVDPSPGMTPLDLEALVSETPGIRRYLTVIWAGMVHDVDIRDMCAYSMRYLFGHFMRSAERPNFDEIVEGAGGTYFDFGSLAINHLAMVVFDIQCRDGDVKWIVQSLSFLSETIVNNALVVMDVLATQGLIKYLINISVALRAKIPPRNPPMLWAQTQIFFVCSWPFVSHHHVHGLLKFSVRGYSSPSPSPRMTRWLWVIRLSLAQETGALEIH